MKVKPLIHHFIAPTYGSEGAAGFDLYLQYDVKVTDKVNLVSLGFAAEIPEGHVGLLIPRSGAGTNKGLHLRNTVGVIDSDYRGEWHLPLIHDHHHPITYLRGERVAQCVVVPVKQVEIELTDELSETKRNAGGFGSTGK